MNMVDLSNMQDFFVHIQSELILKCDNMVSILLNTHNGYLTSELQSYGPWMA